MGLDISVVGAGVNVGVVEGLSLGDCEGVWVGKVVGAPLGTELGTAEKSKGSNSNRWILSTSCGFCK